MDAEPSDRTRQGPRARTSVRNLTCGTRLSNRAARIGRACSKRAVAPSIAERAVRTRDTRRKTMKKLIAMGAALALLGGVTVASAQSSGTPGAGSAGQDQRGADK